MLQPPNLVRNVGWNKGAREKDLEIALLRQQLRIVARRQTKGPTVPRWQKLPLAVLASRLKNFKGLLKLDALLIKPDTLLRWHRELVRNGPLRPSVNLDVPALTST